MAPAILACSSAPPALDPAEAVVPNVAAQQRPRDARVSLGVPELDQMLEGGLMPHRPYLLVGPSGTGKTTLALQFLCEGVRRGERVLYVTLEDPPNEVRWNHRALRPELDQIDVFDAIPDVMRYERVPFKDIAAVRHVLPFGRVPERIRLTPEFSSVEVTGTALEQMVRSEVQKHGYSRLVIDSLTALQYFCMKGFDPTVGAQTFLRFLTDLRTTTLLTVEAPLEDVETPERMLARGEVRLFRWELDGSTVRAVGVEKFRGSAHDVRLHPYRIGSKGVDVQLAQTISRDTRRIVEPALEAALRPELPPTPVPPAPRPAVAVSPEPLADQIRDLVTIGVDVAPLRTEVEATLADLRAGRTEGIAARMARISALAISLAPLGPPPPDAQAGGGELTSAARARVGARADRIREGEPPTRLPPADLLGRELGAVLAWLAPTSSPAPASPPAPVPTILTAATPPLVTSEGPTVTSTPLAPIRAEARPPAPGYVPEGARAASAEPPHAAAAAPPTSSPALPAAPPLPVVPALEGPRLQAGAPEAARPAPRTARMAAVLSIPEPPPLPRAVRLPDVPEAAIPGSAAPAPPATGEVLVPSPMAKAAAPRRRRKPAAKSLPAEPSAPAPVPPEEGAVAVPGVAKPRRRVARRKKAPPVVAASPESPPAEVPAGAGSPAAAASPPPSAEGSTAREGT